MDNPFEYPTDRSEFFEGPTEEEAHFYHTLREFEELIKTSGVDFVLNRIDKETFQQMAQWFLDDDE